MDRRASKIFEDLKKDISNPSIPIMPNDKGTLP